MDNKYKVILEYRYEGIVNAESKAEAIQKGMTVAQGGQYNDFLRLRGLNCKLIDGVDASVLADPAQEKPEELVRPVRASQS